MTKLRKFLTIGVMVMTIIAMSGAFITPAKAAASAGDLIKMAGNSSVYYLGSDSKRYVFPNEATYFSWYKDFSGVITIPATELQSYMLGGNVTMRPGTKLVKIVTDPSVYAVEPNGVLRKIASEADAIALYGSTWATRVVDVADSFFTNYTVGTPLTSNTYPKGSLLKNAGSANVYYYDGTNYRLIASDAAFTANRFNNAYVVTTSMTLTAGGTSITAAETGITNTAQAGGTGPIITGSGLTVALNAMTPAATGIPAGSPVDFLKINLTASNDGVSNISSIKLTSYDLGSALNIDDVTFYDNGVKVGTSKNFTSDKVATFNFATPIAVAAGTTKTLTVKATIAAGQTGNYVIGIAAASDIIASSGTVSGSFPIRGNQMSIVSGTTIGTVGLTNVTDGDMNANFGEDNVLLAGFDLTANNEPVLIQTLKFKNGGTNTADIISNLKLYIDGTEVATGTYADGYVTFTLSNYRIAKSDSVSLEVKGDVGVTNVNDTVALYVKDKNDFAFLGQDYGFGVQLTDAAFAAIDSASTDADVSTITLVAGDFTIDMDKSATGTPSKDVKAGDNDVVLATIVLKSNGENATIEQIVGDDNTADGNDFEIQGTGLAAGELENVEMVDVSTGGVYDITATRKSDTVWNLSMTDEINLVKGVAKRFLIRADMSDTVGSEIDNNDTVKVVLDGAAMTIKGDTSSTSITNITPSSVTSAIATVKDASLSWTPVALTAKTVVGGATDVEVYQATVKAGTADGVKLQSVTLSTTAADATPAFADTNITKFDLYLNGNLLKSISNDITEPTGGAVGTITFNSLNTTYNTIPAGTTYTLSVKASFASSLTPEDTFTLEVTGEGNITSRSVNGNKLVTENGTISGGSRAITLAGNGNLKVELLTTDGKADNNTFILAGSQSSAGRYLAELKFTTVNEPVKVTRLALEETGSAGSDDIASVKLVKADGTVVATQTVESDGDVIFDPFNYVFPADQATSLFVVVAVRGMNVDGDASATADYNQTIIYNIDDAANGVVAKGDNSGADITMVSDPNGSVINGEWSDESTFSKTATIVGSELTTISNDMNDGTLTGGTSKVLGKYKFVFNNGNNRNTANEELKAIFDALTITFSKTSAIALTNVKANIDGTATKVAADTLSTLGAGNTSGSATWNALTLQGLSDSGKVDGEVTLVITGDVAGTSENQYVQTSIADLNGADGNDDVNYIGDGLTGSAALTNMNLLVTEVVGGTLSN